MKRCPGFEEAKNGDIDAAHFVVNRCVKENRIRDFREEYAESFVVPVINRNALPLALAQTIGLKLWDKMKLTDTVPRKSLYAIQRLKHEPTFTGHVEKDMPYIIVDDIVTQGGTVSALRKHIIINGGKVVAVVALAYAIGSHRIAPTKDIRIRLFTKFGGSIRQLQELGLVSSFEELTYSQAKYLLRFSSVRNIRAKLMELDDP